MTTDAGRKHIRGSSMLLCGRLLAVAINFAAQIILVRYLSTTDYGVWAYALSAAAILGAFSTLAFDKAVDRFVAIFHERKQYGKLIGTLIFIGAATLVTGVGIAGAFYFTPDLFVRLIPDDASIALLFILVVAVPFDAFDALLTAAFASLAKPGAIFFRRHLLGPILKLAVSTLLVAVHADVRFLALGYVASSILSVLLCTLILVRLLYKDGLLSAENFRQIEFPFREVVSFTAPLLTSEFIGMLLTSSTPLIIGFFHGPEEVAVFRVVAPLAALNYLVRHTFALLYTAQASRLFAKGDFEGIQQLYWQSTLWMTALTFPLFALTFGASHSVSVFLYGNRYSASGAVLAVMALGTFVQVMGGFSHLTLRALGNVWLIVATDVSTIATFVVLNLLLVPGYGAIGAAVAFSGTLFAFALYRQFALSKAAGVTLFAKDCAGFYLHILGCTAVLIAIQLWQPASIYVALPLVSAVSLSLLALARRQLHIAETFPELRRLLRPIYGSQ